MIILYNLPIISILNLIATHGLLTRKRSMKYCISAYILNTMVLYIAGFFAKRYITDPGSSKYIMYFLASLFILYIYLVFEESLSKKLFAMFSIWLFSTVLLFIAITILDAAPGKAAENTFRYSVYIIRICLEILILPIVYFKFRKVYKKVMRIIPDKMINLMSLYPVIAFLILIKNNAVTLGQHTNFNSIFDVLFVLVLISLGYMLIFAGIASSSKVISLEYNYKIIENQVELQRQNYKKLSGAIDLLYTLKHDTRHHFSAIKTMVAEQKNDRALEYIDQFNQREQSRTFPTLCDNFAADSIIKYYMGIAIDRNIGFTVNINIPEDLCINPLDLCVVLGNCLDNAIDACDKLEASQIKQITLTSKIVGTHIVFKILNNFNGKLNKIDNVIKSSKKEPGHGIGLSSIHETVNRYNGNVDYKYTEDRFEITIIMCHSLSYAG